MDGGDARGARLDVRKTWKAYVGGRFPRSESGRTHPLPGAPATFVPTASRKDLRDAIQVARGAWPGWAGRAGYNRGQVLYRIAEMLETRAAAMAATIVACGGSAADPAAARREVEQAVDLCVWYAGLADKLQALLGAQNDVAGPFFAFSTVEPTGAVGVVCPPAPPLLGLLALTLPLITAGNAAVVVASEPAPLPALAFGEICASADVPAGVVNLLSGRRGDLLPELARHRGLDALLIAGTAADDAAATAYAADSVKRVRHCPLAAADYADSARVRRLDWVAAFVEVKTLWHPVAAR